MDIFGFRDVRDVALAELERAAWQSGDTAAAKLLAAVADGDEDAQDKIADLEKERDDAIERADKAEELLAEVRVMAEERIDALDPLLSQVKPAKVRKALETALQGLYEGLR